MPEPLPVLSEFTRQPVVSLPVSVKDFICVVSVVSNAQHYGDKAVMELTASGVINFGTRYRFVIGFARRLLYP